MPKVIATATPPSPLAGLSLPNSRPWLSSSTAAQNGLHLSKVHENPTIFISSATSASSEELLKKHNIKIIVSLVPFDHMDEYFNINPDADNFRKHQVSSINYRFVSDLDIERFVCILTDNEKNSDKSLRDAYALLKDICENNPNKNILVHCQAGISRSVSLVASVIAKRDGTCFETAAKTISQHREIRINQGLAEHLTRVIALPFDEESSSAN